jgi:prolipoprotein diacylglyceryltransferase
MPPLYTTIGPFTWPTFTLAISVMLVISGAWQWRLLRTGRLFDVALIGLLGGLVGARVEHVLLFWDYFTLNLPEAGRLAAGGLGWHGAVWGSLLGLRLGWWLRRDAQSTQPHRLGVMSTAQLLDRFTPLLPMIGLAAWYGCWAAGCGYGYEVDTLARFPTVIVAELVDVFGIVIPRLNTPLYGMLLALVGLLMVGINQLWRRITPPLPRSTRPFWCVLALLSLGMFVIGFVRADRIPLLLGWRADQLLDMTMFILAVTRVIAFQRYRGENSHG